MATTYHGVDVSVNNGTINWATLAANKDFAFIQAAAVTFGGGGVVPDSKLAANQSGARANSMKRGYYFFVRSSDYNNSSRWGTSNVSIIGANDANYFVTQVGALQAGESMVLDFDLYGVGYAGNPMDDYAYSFCTTVSNYYGSSNLPFCIIYSSLSMLDGFTWWPNTSGITHDWIAATSYPDNDWSLSVSSWHGQDYPGSVSSPADYYFHQYSQGSVPGISGTVDLDSFYSLNDTLADWDLFGHTGGTPPTSGIWTNLAPFTVTPTFTQPLHETIVVPQNNYDKVIYSTTWSDSVTHSSWPQPRTGPLTNIGQTAYPVGNYTFSLNGVTNGAYNDFGFLYPGQGYGTYPGNMPPVVIQPVVSGTGDLSFIVTIAAPSGTQTVDYTVHIALLLSLSPSAMQVPNVTQTVAQANLVPNVFPAYGAYRRIIHDNKVTGTGSHTIAHGQGGIPNVIAFVQDAATGDTEPNPVAWSNVGTVTNAFGLAMDSTNLHFYIDTSLTGAFYRIYQDN